MAHYTMKAPGASGWRTTGPPTGCIILGMKVGARWHSWRHITLSIYHSFLVNLVNISVFRGVLKQKVTKRHIVFLGRGGVSADLIFLPKFHDPKILLHTPLPVFILINAKTEYHILVLAYVS